MKIGFISPPAPGHFNPMSAVARELQSRKYDVVMISLPMMEPLARAANLPFVSFGEKEFSAEKGAEMIETLSRLKGEEALQFGLNGLGRLSAIKWKTLPGVLSANGIDALGLHHPCRIEYGA
jgi:zeaxanthin glucosyltransferase